MMTIHIAMSLDYWLGDCDVGVPSMYHVSVTVVNCITSHAKKRTAHVRKESGIAKIQSADSTAMSSGLFSLRS